MVEGQVGMKRKKKANSKTGRKRRRIVMERLIKLGEDDGSFDAEYWHRVGPQGRIDAVWELSVEHWRKKGIDLRTLKLDKSVEKLTLRSKMRKK